MMTPDLNEDSNSNSNSSAHSSSNSNSNANTNAASATRSHLEVALTSAKNSLVVNNLKRKNLSDHDEEAPVQATASASASTSSSALDALLKTNIASKVKEKEKEPTSSTKKLMTNLNTQQTGGGGGDLNSPCMLTREKQKQQQQQQLQLQQQNQQTQIDPSLAKTRAQKLKALQSLNLSGCASESVNHTDTNSNTAKKVASSSASSSPVSKKSSLSKLWPESESELNAVPNPPPVNPTSSTMNNAATSLALLNETNASTSGALASDASTSLNKSVSVYVNDAATENWLNTFKVCVFLLFSWDSFGMSVLTKFTRSDFDADSEKIVQKIFGGLIALIFRLKS